MTYALCSVVDAASAKNVLYGAYDNVISTVGVSAMWSGVIHTSGAGDTVPTVVVQGKSATPLAPDNLAFPAKHIVFYEKGAKSKSLTEDEAVQRCVHALMYLHNLLYSSSLTNIFHFITSSTTPHS